MEQPNEGMEPCGGPKPVRGAPWECRPVGAVTVVGLLAAGALVVAVCPVRVHRTYGATRSAHLKWEQRQRDIEQSIHSVEPVQAAEHVRTE